MNVDVEAVGRAVVLAGAIVGAIKVLLPVGEAARRRLLADILERLGTVEERQSAHEADDTVHAPVEP